MDRTPDSLRSVIRGALLVGPLSGAEDRVVEAVGVFLRQKFQVAILVLFCFKATDELLHSLYSDIVEDPIKDARK